jgi:WD40 repeat protein
LFLGLVVLGIILNFASLRRGVGHRHDPNYSDATITDVPVLVLAGPPKSLATRVAFSPDGKSVAAGFDGAAPAVKVWDSTTGEARLNVYQWSVWDVAFSPDGKYVAASGHDDHPMIYDAHTGEVVRTFKGPEIHGMSIAFSAGGKDVATGNGEGVQIWDVATGRQLLNAPELRDSTHSIKFSSDGRLLAAGGNDWSVRVWDTTQWMELLKFRGHSREVLGVAFSPDGTRIASASRDGSVKVWHATNGQEIVTFTGHCVDAGSCASAVAFSPDGKHIASLGRDGAARVWRADNAAEIRAFDIGNKRPFPAFLGVAFSPDGKRIAASSGGSTVKVWKVED